MLLVFGTQVGAQQPRPAYPKPQIEKLDVAPDFTLRDQDGQPFQLSEQRRPVMLFFYRGYW
jgi:cytochrome oxidase Cu insertion factor (SCO1/SenC/PrrC family)